MNLSLPLLFNKGIAVKFFLIIFVIYLAGSLVKAFYQIWIECAAFSAIDHLYSCFKCKSRFIYTLADKCVIHICNRNNLCGYRYLISCKSVRISFTVPAFVMAAADGITVFVNPAVLKAFHAGKHFAARSCMRLHDLKFFRSKAAFTCRFIQDPVWDVYFTNIVENGSL